MLEDEFHSEPREKMSFLMKLSWSVLGLIALYFAYLIVFGWLPFVLSQ